MPDGDRFERTLHGKWWRKAYRQACAGESFQMLGDTLMKAAADALRRQLACTALAKIRDAVYQALKEKARAAAFDPAAEDDDRGTPSRHRGIGGVTCPGFSCQPPRPRTRSISPTKARSVGSRLT